jgi:hypothetical protein
VKPWVKQKMEKAPAGAKENLHEQSLAKFLSPLPGLDNLSDTKPTAIAMGYYHALLRS